MTNFFGDGLPFNPDAPAHRLKEQLTDLFFNEDWFVGAGVRRMEGRQEAFLMVDQLALSPKLIFAGFGNIIRSAFPNLFEAGNAPAAVHLGGNDIFYTEPRLGDDAPFLAIEMTLSGARGVTPGNWTEKSRGETTRSA